jgi:hypothetical protein
MLIILEEKISKLKNYKELQEFIRENGEKLNDYQSYLVTISPYFNLKLINENNATFFDWSEICTNHRDLSETFMEKYAAYLDWYSISAFQKLSIKFIKKFEDKLSFNVLMGNENFINSTETISIISKMYEVRKEKSSYQNIWKKNLMNSIFKPYKSISITNSDYNDKYTLEDLKGKSKEELKQILSEKGIRAYYHDTLDILKQKIIGGDNNDSD